VSAISKITLSANHVTDHFTSICTHDQKSAS